MEKPLFTFIWALCVILTAFGQVGEDTGYRWIESKDPSLVWSGAPSPELGARLEGVYLVTQCAYHCIEQGTHCTSYQYHHTDFTCSLFSDQIDITENATGNDDFRIYDKDYLTIDLVSNIISLYYCITLNFREHFIFA